MEARQMRAASRLTRRLRHFMGGGRRMSMSVQFVQFCGAQVLVPDDPVNGTSGELPTVAANAEAKSSSEQVCRDLVQSMVLMFKPSSP